MPAVAELVYGERDQAVLFLEGEAVEGELSECLGCLGAVPAVLLGEEQHLIEGALEGRADGRGWVVQPPNCSASRRHHVKRPPYFLGLRSRLAEQWARRVRRGERPSYLH